MLTKLVDMALRATFLTVHLLYRFRSYLHPETPAADEEDGRPNTPEEARLMAEWIEARRRSSALQAEIDQPTISRLHGSQAKLFQAAKAAGAKCQNVLRELRAYRQARRKSQRRKR